MTDYVAGSLSALFNKKASKNSENNVQLKHVKQLYEEFEPKKPPKEIGQKSDDYSKPQSSKKRHNDDQTDGNSIKKPKRSFYEGKASSKFHQNPNVENDEQSDDDPEQPLSNKRAALKRLNKKAKDKKKKTTEKQLKKDKDGEEETEESENKRKFRYYEDDPAFAAQTIFIKNLPPKAQRKHMKKLFGKCGEILFIRFANAVPAKTSIPAEAAIKKRSLIKEGTTICAYIVFKDPASVQTALNLNGIEFEGHHLRVDKREASNVPQKRSVFCGNLPFDTTDDELWTFFEEAGEIDYVRIVRDNLTGEGKGIAFVVFKEASSALIALEFGSKTFKERTIRVSAVEKRKTAPMASYKTAQIGGSKEKINKKKLEKKSQQQQNKLTTGKLHFSKHRKEKIKKTIKKEKAQKIKRKVASKLQANKTA